MYIVIAILFGRSRLVLSQYSAGPQYSLLSLISRPIRRTSEDRFSTLNINYEFSWCTAGTALRDPRSRWVVKIFSALVGSSRATAATAKEISAAKPITGATRQDILSHQHHYESQLTFTLTTHPTLKAP